MIRYHCKGCGRLSAQYAERCLECNQPLFCNVCGYYEDDMLLKRARELIRKEHRKEEHVSIDLV